jgi:hypothetical protein
MYPMIKLKRVGSTIGCLLQEEQAQDLIEYTLLLAFICIATAALFVSSGGSLCGRRDRVHFGDLVIG